MFGCLTRRSVKLSHSARSLVQRSLAASSPTGDALPSPRPSREYPDSPRVGIGVIILRKVEQQTEVLLIRRGREPQKGILSFPGGSLELGETMADCAVRETLEETGVTLRNRPSKGPPAIRSLDFPRPVDAVDAFQRDDDGRVKYHYTIVDLAAVPEDPHAEPVAGDDAEEVIWKPVKELPNLIDLTEHCARIAEEAVLRFDIPEG